MCRIQSKWPNLELYTTDFIDTPEQHENWEYINDFWCHQHRFAYWCLCFVTQSLNIPQKWRLNSTFCCRNNMFHFLWTLACQASRNPPQVSLKSGVCLLPFYFEQTELLQHSTPNCYDVFIFIRCTWLAERSESVPYALHTGSPRIRKDQPNQWRPFVAGQTSGSKALMKTPQSGQLFISIGWSVGG